MGTHIATLTLNKSSQTTIPKVVRDLLGLGFFGNFPFLPVEATADKSTLKITKEKSLIERLEEIRKKYSTPEQEAIKAHTANMTVAEMREEWDNSPEGRKYYAEKYGVKTDD